MFTEIAPAVFVFSSRFVEAKYGVVIGAKTSLVIDAPYYEDEARAMADFVISKGRAPNRVQFTHGHGDHVLGAGAFDDAEVFAHALTPEVMRFHLERWAANRGAPSDELLKRAIWPTVLARGELTHDMGNVRARVFAAPGHSPDGQAVFIEEHGVLFAGDTATTGIVPAIEWGDSRTLEASQRMLARMDIDVLVPGHGDVIHGRVESREWLMWMADYLATTRGLVREGMAAGDDAEHIAQRASYERCVGARFEPSRNGMVRRHDNNVRALIKEET